MDRWMVRAKRTELDILNFELYQSTPYLIARLGRESYTSIARRMGVSEPTVSSKRKAHGIPQYSSGG